ncbi:hypothetical protein [Oculatella sp. LEGE 06141]|uniref:hypothetical protein n=1 Tax=Oculatella sp. LEGE 06141 TaxID=1828648 RepID=UPI0018820952|nr:hypothetical protein [Oculatella sp. LEGE 06141]
MNQVSALILGDFIRAIARMLLTLNLKMNPARPMNYCGQVSDSADTTLGNFFHSRGITMV